MLFAECGRIGPHPTLEQLGEVSDTPIPYPSRNFLDRQVCRHQQDLGLLETQSGYVIGEPFTGTARDDHTEIVRVHPEHPQGNGTPGI